MPRTVCRVQKQFWVHKMHMKFYEIPKYSHSKYFASFIPSVICKELSFRRILHIFQFSEHFSTLQSWLCDKMCIAYCMNSTFHIEYVLHILVKCTTLESAWVDIATKKLIDTFYEPKIMQKYALIQLTSKNFPFFSTNMVQNITK